MNIQAKMNLYMEGKGLHQEKHSLFGKKLFPIPIPMFLNKLFLNMTSIIWLQVMVVICLEKPN